MLVPINIKAQIADELKVYVWDFSNRDGTKDGLTEKFTVEFEEALIQTNYYDVLSRRDYDKLFSQRSNEKGIMDIEGISKSHLDTLKILKADAVVFGEIYDDTLDGRIRITVKIQSFDTEILAQQSTKLERGLKNHASSREEKMRDLARKFSPDRLQKFEPLQYPEDKRQQEPVDSSETDDGLLNKKDSSKKWLLFGGGAIVVTAGVVVFLLTKTNDQDAGFPDPPGRP